jgi:hypothetical protein
MSVHLRTVIKWDLNESPASRLPLLLRPQKTRLATAHDAVGANPNCHHRKHVTVIPPARLRRACLPQAGAQQADALPCHSRRSAIRGYHRKAPHGHSACPPPAGLPAAGRSVASRRFSSSLAPAKESACAVYLPWRVEKSLPAFFRSPSTPTPTTPLCLLKRVFDLVQLYIPAQSSIPT